MVCCIPWVEALSRKHPRDRDMLKTTDGDRQRGYRIGYRSLPYRLTLNFQVSYMDADNWSGKRRKPDVRPEQEINQEDPREPQPAAIYQIGRHNGGGIGHSAMVESASFCRSAGAKKNHHSWRAASDESGLSQSPRDGACVDGRRRVGRSEPG